MNLTHEFLEKVLSEGNRRLLGGIIGFSAGGLIAAAGVYGCTQYGWQADHVIFALGIAIVAAWITIAVKTNSTGDRAKKLSAILGDPNAKFYFDNMKRRFVVEQKSTVTLPGGTTAEAIIGREELTTEEASRIGFMSGAPSLPMLNAPVSTSPSHRRQFGQTVDADESVSPTVQPATVS